MDAQQPPAGARATINDLPNDVLLKIAGICWQPPTAQIATDARCAPKRANPLSLCNISPYAEMGFISRVSPLWDRVRALAAVPPTFQRQPCLCTSSACVLLAFAPSGLIRIFTPVATPSQGDLLHQAATLACVGSSECTTLAHALFTALSPRMGALGSSMGAVLSECAVWAGQRSRLPAG